LTQHKIRAITQLIEAGWDRSNAWQDFVQAMHMLLPTSGDQKDLDLDPNRFALLPELSCQAAGGDPELTGEISAAWLLLYIAAHLVDSVEDEDAAEEIQILGGKGPAVNIANGLFLSAGLLLNQLHGYEKARHLAQEISTDFYNTILIMTSGQHRDLKTRRLTAAQWQQIAEAKSGEFFSLACRSGARLAVDDPFVIKGYSDYGFHLGVMLQIHDDFEDLQDYIAAGEKSAPLNLKRSLAVAHALDILPETENKILENWLESSPGKSELIEKILKILDDSGAGLYMAAQLEHRYYLARTSLKATNPLSPAGEKLFYFISQLKLV
jgi:geranylgeranyl pyrophosphate synthase